MKIKIGDIFIININNEIKAIGQIIKIPENLLTVVIYEPITSIKITEEFLNETIVTEPLSLNGIQAKWMLDCL